MFDLNYIRFAAEPVAGECLLLALSGHANDAEQCLLSGAKQTPSLSHVELCAKVGDGMKG
jgi:hypothetical protein